MTKYLTNKVTVDAYCIGSGMDKPEWLACEYFMPHTDNYYVSYIGWNSKKCDVDLYTIRFKQGTWLIRIDEEVETLIMSNEVFQIFFKQKYDLGRRWFLKEDEKSESDN